MKGKGDGCHPKGSMHKPRLCLPRKIFLIIGLNNRCVEIYIDLSTNEHDLTIYVLCHC